MHWLDPSLQDRVNGSVDADGAANALTPLITGPTTIVWIVVATTIVLFLGIISLFMRRRAASSARYSRAAQSKFFQPAGEDADITFDEEDRSSRKRALQDEVRIDAVEEDPNVAEVIIERPESEDVFVNEPYAPERKKGRVFSGIFNKKRTFIETDQPAAEPNGLLDETDADLQPPVNDPYESTRGSLHREVDDRDFQRDKEAVDTAATVKRKAEEEAEEIRRRASEDARRLTEENAKRIAAEEARLAAEREAEFERRKQAALEQSRAMSAQTDNEVTRKIEEKLAALSERLDQAPRPASQPASFAADDHTATKDDRSTEILVQRFNEHREAVDTSLASMAQRLNEIAGAPVEMERLRNDIAELRGALGGRLTPAAAPAVQLSDIVRNALPPDSYDMNAILPNNRKADCLVRLPNPPGPVAIDSRFPVEAYNRLMQALANAEGVDLAENEFRRAALRHVVDIAERLIIPEETAESAIMFLPSENIYTELHSRFPDVVQDSYRARVWIVSPTTLMATLHTIRAIVRDAHVRESASVIHTEAQHVLGEVEDLRKRVTNLEESFERLRTDVRAVISTTDQVYKRAETITRSGHTGSIQQPDKPSVFRESTLASPSAAPSQPTPRQQAPQPLREPDLWESEPNAQPAKPDFPLR